MHAERVIGSVVYAVIILLIDARSTAVVRCASSLLPMLGTFVLLRPRPGMKEEDGKAQLLHEHV